MVCHFEITDDDLAFIHLEDEKVSEWERLIGESTLTTRDFATGLGTHGRLDLGFRIWIGWHDRSNRIYLTIERWDDLYVHGFRGELPPYLWAVSRLV